jgi:hypothetical protein
MAERSSESRQRLQFSLRTLLYLITFACCVIGIRRERVLRKAEIAALTDEFREQLAEATEKNQAEVEYWRRNFRDQLGHRSGEMKGLNSGGRREIPFIFLASIDEAKRHGAEEIEEAVVVVDEDWKGGDIGLWHLGAYQNLSSLHITNSSLTNDGLYCLRDLRSLKELQLNMAAVDDRCLDHVACLSQLRTLQLKCPQITADGLRRLKTLKRLQHLVLQCDRVTDDQIDQLRAVFPRAKIQRAGQAR